MDGDGDAARLAREARIWRVATCCLAALAVPVGMTLAQSGAPDPVAAARPIAVLEVPPDPKLKITGDHIEQDVAAKKMVVSGGVTLTWSNGVRLTVPTARVSLNTGGEKPAAQRITVGP